MVNSTFYFRWSDWSVQNCLPVPVLSLAAKDNQRLNEAKILSDLSKIGVPAVHVRRNFSGAARALVDSESVRISPEASDV
jgi:hypothetical protein